MEKIQGGNRFIESEVENSIEKTAGELKMSEQKINKPDAIPKEKSRSRVGRLVSRLVSKSSKYADDSKVIKEKTSSNQVKRKLNTANEESNQKRRKKLFDLPLKNSSKRDKQSSASESEKFEPATSIEDSKEPSKNKDKCSDNISKTREQLRVQTDLREIFGSVSPTDNKCASHSKKDTKSKDSAKSATNVASSKVDCSRKEDKKKSTKDKYSKKSKDKGLKGKSSGANSRKEIDKLNKPTVKSSQDQIPAGSVKPVDRKKEGVAKSSSSTSTSLSGTKFESKDSAKKESGGKGDITVQRHDREKTGGNKVTSLAKSSVMETNVTVEQTEQCDRQVSAMSSKVEFDKPTTSVGPCTSQSSECSECVNTNEDIETISEESALPSGTSAVSLSTTVPVSTTLESCQTNIGMALKATQESQKSSSSNSRESSRSSSRQSSVSRSNTPLSRVGSRSSSRQSSMSRSSTPLSRGGSRSNSRQSSVSRSNTPSSRIQSRSSSRQSLQGPNSPKKEEKTTLNNDEVEGLEEGQSKSPTRRPRDSSPRKECPGMEQLRRLSEQLSSLDSSNVMMPSPLQASPDKRIKLISRFDKSPRRLQLKSLSPRKGLNNSPRRKHFGKSPKFSPQALKSPRLTKTPEKSKLKRRLYEKSPLKMGKKRKISSPEEKPPRKALRVQFEVSDQSSGDEWVSDDASSPLSSNSPGDTQLTDSDRDPTFFPNSSISSDSCVDEQALAIDCDVKELDVELDNKSKKLKLTARNVKSIISEVIKNEHVSELFRKSLMDNGWEDQLKEAIFEPKMTRSRVKEVIQNGNFPPPWTLSPIKGLKQVPKETLPSILDMNFSENEDDQEYKPTLEELEQTDDDDLSMMSSQASELGSPLMGGLQQMGPSTPKELVFGRKLFTESSSTPKSGAEHSDTEDEELIAERTRSKLPLKDTPLDVLESNFVAPDITADMYDTKCNDKDWTCFLESLNKDQLNDTYDDEQNDPEFNFLAEQEQEELDREDYRDDKAVRISKKELNELMDELFEAYGGADLLDEDENTRDGLNVSQQSEATQWKQAEECVSEQKVVCTSSSVSDESDPSQTQQISAAQAARLKYPGHLPPLKLDPTLARLLVSDIIKIQTQARDGGKGAETHITDLTGSLAMTAEELVQMQDQMRKHVQLLCQTFIQAEKQTTLTEVSNLSKGYLMELQHLGNKTLGNGFETSYFHPPNLSEAIELTQTQFEEDSGTIRGMLKEKMVYDKVITGPNFDLYGLSMWQMKVFASRKVFMFPQMLPESRFPLVDVTDKRRIVFTEAEDNLLIIGLQQFQHMTNKFYYVQRFLLPCKTQEQIRTHCKNLRAKRKLKMPSALQDFLKAGKVPPFERYVQLEDSSNVVPPSERNPELLPQWWPVYKEIKKDLSPPDHCFIPIKPNLSDEDDQRKTPTYSALLKAKKVSKHEPTDQTVGLSGLQHFKTNISCPPSRPGTPVTTSIEPSVSLSVTSKPSASQTLVTRTRHHSGSSTDSTNSELVGMEGQGDSAEIEERHPVSSVTAILKNNGSLSTVTVLSSVRNLQSSSHQQTLTSSLSSSISSSTSLSASTAQYRNPSQPCLNKRAMKMSLPDVDMNITNDLDAIHPSVTFNPTTGNISISEAAIFSNSSNSESTLSAGILTKSSLNSSISSTVPVSMQAVGSLTSVGQPSALLYKTPSKGDNAGGEVGSPSLISTAMAEVIGVSVSDLCTPEGIKKMGITPSKVPGLVHRPAEKKADVRKSLTAVYEAEGKQTNTEASEEKAVASVDPEVEKKNKNLIMGILQEKEDPKTERKSRNFITEILEEPTQSPTHKMDYSEATVNIPDTPPKLPSSAKSSTQVTPVGDRRAQSVDFFKISPVDLNLIAENSTIFPDKPIQRLQDFDCESTLVTPKKVNFEDFYKESPSSSRHSADCTQLNSLPFGITALGTPDTPTKAAVKLMAELAGEIQSPEKPAVSLTSSATKSLAVATGQNTPPEKCSSLSTGNSNISPVKESPNMPTFTGTAKISPVPCQGRKTLSFAGQISPRKSTPVKVRPLLPDGPLPKTPEKSPIFKKTTPRRKILKQNARAIAPKGLVQISSYISPVKQVAAAISARAKNYVSPQKKPPGRLRTILPKSPKTPSLASPMGKRRIFSPTEEVQYGLESGNKGDFEEDIMEGASDKDIEEEFVMTRRQRRLLKKQRVEQLKEEEDKENDTPSDGGAESQDEMDEDEQEHLNQLMAASTTIRFDPRQQETNQLKSKGQIKKDTILEMLAPDLLEADPLRDERDTAFAQSYMNKVRESLQNEPEKYSRFLNLLYEFGSSKSAPTDLYTDMYHLFAGHPELLEDFSSFLLPGQAKECGCLMAHLEFQKARTFLRKLEVHFKRLPGMLQRVLKTFAKWESLPTKNIKDLQDEIRPLLKGQQYLLDEFATFFEEERVPDSYMTDFEEVNFVSGDEDMAETFDGFEEVTIAGSDDSLYGTKMCICQCHSDVDKPDYRERKKHCISCGIKIIKGRLYLQCDNRLRPLHIKYSHPVKLPDGTEQEVEEEDDEIMEEDLGEDDEIVEEDLGEEDEDEEDEEEDTIEDEDEKDEEGMAEDDEEVIEDDEEVIEDDEEGIEDEKDDEEVLEDEEDIAEDDDEDDEEFPVGDEDKGDTGERAERIVNDHLSQNGDIQTEGLAEDDEEKDETFGEDKEGVQEEDDEEDVEEFDLNEDVADEEELSLSEGEEDKDDDEEDEEFSSDEESEGSDEGGGEEEDEMDMESELEEEPAAITENKEKEGNTDTQQQDGGEEKDKCPVNTNPTDFSEFTKEIQLVQEQEAPADNLASRSSGSNPTDHSSASKLSNKLSDASGSTSSRVDSNSSQTETSQDPKDTRTVQTSLPGPPVVVDETASFNLVSQTGGSTSDPSTDDRILARVGPSSKNMDAKALFGEFSDTEDTVTMAGKMKRESLENVETKHDEEGSDDPIQEREKEGASGTVHRTVDKWSIEEDKLILEKVQVSGPSDHIFKALGVLLGKSAQRVEERFATLLALLTANQDTADEQSEDNQ